MGKNTIKMQNYFNHFVDIVKLKTKQTNKKQSAQNQMATSTFHSKFDVIVLKNLTIVKMQN